MTGLSAPPCVVVGPPTRRTHRMVFWARQWVPLPCLVVSWSFHRPGRGGMLFDKIFGFQEKPNVAHQRQPQAKSQLLLPSGSQVALVPTRRSFQQAVHQLGRLRPHAPHVPNDIGKKAHRALAQ